MRAPLAIAIFLALTFSASAAEECVPTTSPATASAAGWYVVIDDCRYAQAVIVDPSGSFDPTRPLLQEIVDVSMRCIVSAWLYLEVNEIAGLQRGDIVHDDTCGAIEADTIWYWAYWGGYERLADPAPSRIGAL